MPGPTNPPVELARYTAGGTTRIIRGQRVDGNVRLTDVAEPRTAGRAYLIERELTSMAEINGILADYLDQAAKHDTVPASESLLHRELVELAA